MARATSQERRKQILKQRRAQEIRERGREDAKFLFQEALYAHRKGDIPTADRLAKKALLQNHEHEEALRLLAQIHDVAGHHAEALGYLHQLRRFIPDPVVLYNTGVVYEHMGQAENALQTMREFLAATETFREPKWRRLRESAEALCEVVRLRSQVAKPAPAPLPKPPARAPKLSETPKQEKAPELPRASVQFFPPAAPSFAQPGTLADYFLRRQLDRVAAGAEFRRSALPAVAERRGCLCLSAGDRTQSAAAFQRARAAGRRGWAWARPSKPAWF